MKDLAAIHDHDCVGNRKCFFLVVRDVKRADTDFFDQTLELDAHFFAQFSVEVAEWLVEQNEPRLQGEAARQGDALLLPAAQLRWISLIATLEANEIERRQDLLLDFLSGFFMQLEAEGDILENRHVRPQRIILKYETDLARIRRHEDAALDRRLHLVGNGNRSCIRNLETGDRSQQCRLAATGRTEKRKNPFVELEINVVERFDVFVEFSYTFDF